MDKEKMKSEAFELLEQIDNEKILWMILGTVKSGFTEQEAIRRGITDSL